MNIIKRLIGRKPGGKAARLYRQGDVFVQQVVGMPKGAPKLAHGVLAHGELTGHSHRLEDTSIAVLYGGPPGSGEHFLEVVAEVARVLHEEHAPIELEPGIYRVWRQREYTPTAIVRVMD